MRNGPAFQIYAADFFMDTIDWTVEEIGIYWRLLQAQWVNQTLPNDPDRLARIAGCGPKKFSSGWKKVKSKFKLTGEGQLQNEKLEQTRQAQRKYRESQGIKGKKGAQKRWGNNGHSYNSGHNRGYNTGNGRNIALQSSYKKERKQTKKERYSEVIKQTDNLCKTLSSFFKDNIFQIRQGWINNGCHPEAISYCLNTAWEQRKTIRKVRGYFAQIMKIEGQNANERDAIEKHERIKKEMEDIVKGLSTK